MTVAADEDKVCVIEICRYMIQLLAVARCWNCPELLDFLAQTAEELRGIGISWRRDEVIGDDEWFAIDELGRRRFEVLLDNCPQAQKDPR